MTNVLARFSLVAAILCAAGAVTASVMADDEPLTSGGLDNAARVQCGLICHAEPDTFCVVGLCPAGTTCCGWGRCFTGGCIGYLECCGPNQSCDNGLGTTPPHAPSCNTINAP